MIDLIILLVYFVVVLLVGFYTMRKISDFSDYSVAGRTMPFSLIFATVGATLAGGGATIGRVAFVYDIGIVVFLALMGVVISQTLVGLFLAPRIRQMDDIHTIGDIMHFYFGRSGQLVTSIFSLVFMVGMFGVQALALGRILEPVIGLPFVTLTIIGALITVIYTWAGGMLAVVYTDALQFILLIGGIATATIIGLNKIGGMPVLMDKVSSINPDQLVLFGGSWTVGIFIANFLAFLLGEALAPHYIQRYAASDSVRTATWSTVSFAFMYIFLTIVIMVIGLIGFVIFPSMDGDLVFVRFVIEFLPVGIVGLVFGALVAAVMSTGSSILNAGAVIFSKDIYAVLINKDADDNQMVKASRYATIFVGLAGIGISLMIPSVMDLMLLGFKMWGASVLPPLVVALVWGGARESKVSPSAAVPAILSGITATLIWLEVFGEPFSIPAIAVGVVTNLLVFSAVHSFTVDKYKNELDY